MERIIGIDLGTTNSLAATVFDGGPEVIEASGESSITPSVLSWTDSGWLVGEEAQKSSISKPENTIFSIKRLMGRSLKDLGNSVNELPYQIVEAQRQLIKVKIGEKEYTPQELSAEILKKVKTNAESILGEPVKKAVITVPAYFDDAQRQATRDAARFAGLEVARIINEPTAAAIAYGLDEKKEGYIAVYDLGGGTFDISILKLSGKIFKVIATHGNTQLGGDDFDKAVANEIKKKNQIIHPEVKFEGPESKLLLKKTAESIKKELSFSTETSYSMELPNIELTFDGRFKLEEFENLIDPMIDQTLVSCNHVLREANLTVEQIDEVVLVGGSTIIPKVRKRIESFFRKPPHVAIDPYKVVAIGAGIQGHLLAGGRRDFLLLDVIPLALGIETLGGTFSKIITGNTTVPAEESETFTTNVDNQTSIDVNIYQGERELIKNCRALGQFKLRGIPPMKSGYPLVQVQFSVDANGILTVSAAEKRSGKKAEIEVIPFHGLTQFEIESIIEDSYEHAVDDFNQRQLIEFCQTAERIFRGIEQTWEVAEYTLTKKEQAEIQEQMESVRQSMQGQDAQALKAQLDVLGDLTRPLADNAMGRTILAELKDNENVI
ncbi:MAG: Fe-S protein assembly chaperone HscA [SAR324 cluster bacterium]|jgi:molecular chaperone DnaK (HSP70)|nr:Fe-S protein assembly chaperone HscA [SAR324 cluster bacterium]|tara:strand:+ start:2503 stop:4323 length:1821 start_codon:yes stop_codon:yes gene_type:complete